MSQALTNLLALLNLEKIEEGLFRGTERRFRPAPYLVGKWSVRPCMPPKRQCPPTAPGSLLSQLLSASGR